MGGMDAVRKATALEKLDVQIVTPEDKYKNNKGPSLPFMPQRSPLKSRGSRDSPSNRNSPGIRGKNQWSPGLKKAPNYGHFGGAAPF